MSVVKLFVLGVASLALIACDHMNIAEIHQKTITGSDYRSHLALSLIHISEPTRPY